MGCAGPGASEQTADDSLEKGAVGLPALHWETASSAICSGVLRFLNTPFLFIG